MPSKGKVWVDVDSGTWGPIESLRVVYVHDLEEFAEVSDSTRVWIAGVQGEKIDAQG